MFQPETKEKIKSSLLISLISITVFVLLMNFGKVISCSKWLMSIVSPFLIAIAVAYVLNIWMTFLENKVFFKMAKSKKIWVQKCQRPLCLTLSFVLAFAVLTAIVMFVVPDLASSLKTLADNVPNYALSLQAKLMGVLNQFDISTIVIEKLTKEWSSITEKLVAILSEMVPQIFNVTVGITSGIVNFFIGLIAAVYMLYSKEKLLCNLKKVLYSFTSKRVADTTMHICQTANKSFNSFISGQIIEAFILGMLCFIGMSIFRFKYALLISVIVGVTGLIPIFGAFLGAAPGAILLFVISPWQAFWFIIFIIVLQQIEGNLIYPHVVGSSIGLSGLWVMFAMIVGGGIAGLLGILIGIPSFSALYVLLRETVTKRLKKRNLQIE